MAHGCEQLSGRSFTSTSVVVATNFRTPADGKKRADEALGPAHVPSIAGMRSVPGGAERVNTTKGGNEKIVLDKPTT